MPYVLGLPGTAQEGAGRATGGRRLLAEVLDIASTSGERRFEAGLHRLEGELALAEGDRAGFEACLQRALTVAREQNAIIWELRAATSLARLWRDQDRRIEARDLLARIYARFTEGFGCADLKKGEALLDALA